jgi:hypothetical protein
MRGEHEEGINPDLAEATSSFTSESIQAQIVDRDT